jgi:hypothetical protein
MSCMMQYIYTKSLQLYIFVFFFLGGGVEQILLIVTIAPVNTSE